MFRLSVLAVLRAAAGADITIGPATTAPLRKPMNSRRLICRLNGQDGCPMTSAVPELTCSGNIKLKKRLSLRRREDRIR